MTQHKDPDTEVVALINGQITKLLAETEANGGEPMSNYKLVYAVCHLYENRDFVRQEAGMDAPKASKRDLQVSLICDKIDKMRQLALFGDKDAMKGLQLVELACPFFREHGVEIKKMLRGTA